MIKEFKEFISRGNVVDMAVGIIIGGAFGKIIASLVNDVIMPVVGLLTGGTNVSNMFITLKEGATPETAVLLKYGSFLQAVIDFLIIAFVIFIMIKAMNKLRRKQEVVEEAAPVTPEDILLLREIRDSLKK